MRLTVHVAHVECVRVTDIQTAWSSAYLEALIFGELVIW